MGINKTTTKLLAFAMGASTAGFSGVIFSGLQGFVSPESFILLESITILAMVVLGGMGSIPGVVLGAVILVVVPEVLREYAQYRFTIFGLGLTLMMLVRPEGLWPVRVRAAGPRRTSRSRARPPTWRRVRRRRAWSSCRGAIAEAGTGARDGFLAIDGVSKSFGGLRAVNAVSFSVARGQLVAVIGPNGAGKTTLFNLITGVYPVTVGRDPLRGTGASRGCPRTRSPRSASPAPTRTSACSAACRSWTTSSSARTAAPAPACSTPCCTPERASHEERESRERARALLDFFGIRKYEAQLAMNLPYGDQRRLEIARALATQPVAAAPRRAGGRHEPRRDPGADRADPADPRSRRHHRARRARHEGRHAGLGEHRRPRPRREDRRGPAGPDPARCRG